MILIHIIVATSSLVFTGFLYFFPSQQRLKVAYALVGATLLTGFYLILSLPAQMTRTCITGLTYLAIVSVGIVFARKKLSETQS